MAAELEAAGLQPSVITGNGPRPTVGQRRNRSGLDVRLTNNDVSREKLYALPTPHRPHPRPRLEGPNFPLPSPSRVPSRVAVIAIYFRGVADAGGWLRGRTSSTGQPIADDVRYDLGGDGRELVG